MVDVRSRFRLNCIKRYVTCISIYELHIEYYPVTITLQVLSTAWLLLRVTFHPTSNNTMVKPHSWDRSPFSHFISSFTFLHWKRIISKRECKWLPWYQLLWTNLIQLVISLHLFWTNQLYLLLLFFLQLCDLRRKLFAHKCVEVSITLFIFRLMGREYLSLFTTCCNFYAHPKCKYITWSQESSLKVRPSQTFSLIPFKIFYLWPSVGNPPYGMFSILLICSTVELTFCQLWETDCFGIVCFVHNR